MKQKTTPFLIAIMTLISSNLRAQVYDSYNTTNNAYGTITTLTSTDVTVTSLGYSIGDYNSRAAIISNGIFFFFASTASTGDELWVSDGTPSGTMMLKDIEPGASSSTPHNMVEVNGKVYFAATTSSTGTELWVSDGTAAGTNMVIDLFVGYEGSDPNTITPFKDGFLFAAVDLESSNYDGDGLSRQQVWFSDGTIEGTNRLSGNNRYGVVPKTSGDAQKLSYFQVIGELAIFGGTSERPSGSGVLGEEIWVTDGTPEPWGTKMLVDINPPTDYSNIEWVFAANDEQVIFRAKTPGEWDGQPDILHLNNEYWVTDGTHKGTYLLEDLNDLPGYEENTTGNTGAAVPFQFDGNIYFRANSGLHTELHKITTLAGGVGGIELVKDIAPINQAGSELSSFVDDFIAFDEKLFFKAGFVSDLGDFPRSGSELGMYDPVAEEVYLVADIFPGATTNSFPRNKTIVNGRMYFTANTGNSNANFDIWALDIKDDQDPPVPELDNLSLLDDYIVYKVFDDIDGLNNILQTDLLNLNENLIFKTIEGTLAVFDDGLTKVTEPYSDPKSTGLPVEIGSNDYLDAPPVVNLMYPVPGSTFFEGEDILLSVSATDPEGVGISKVEYYEGDFFNTWNLLGTATSGDFSYLWKGASYSEEPITITALAFDANDSAFSMPSRILITPYEAPEIGQNLTEVNGKLVWQYYDELVTYDLDNRRYDESSGLNSISHLETYGDFAIASANETSGVGHGLMWTDGKTYEMLADWPSSSGRPFYHGGVFYQPVQADAQGAITGSGSEGFTKLWVYKDGVGSQLTDITDDGKDLADDNFYTVAPYGDSEILFAASDDGGVTFNLYRTDGSTTTLITENHDIENLPFAAVSSTKVLFFASNITDNVGVELYQYDGISVSLVSDLLTGSTGSSPYSEGVVVDGYTYFSALSNNHSDMSLYRSNGTVTEEVYEFDGSGTRGGLGIQGFAVLGDNKVFFQANDIDEGNEAEPWISDGTAVGTFQLMDINTSAASMSSAHINNTKTIDGGVVFSATNGTEIGVYYTDGTVLGTSLISNLSLHENVKIGDDERGLVAIGSRAFFTDDNDELFEITIPVTGTTTLVGSTWSDLEPSPVKNAIVIDILTIGSSSIMEMQNLEVTSNSSITVEDGSTLVVKGDIFNDGTITIESGASLITYDEEYLIGTDIIFERNTSYDDGRYSFVGIPVEADTKINGSTLGSNFVFKYNETTAYDLDEGLSRWEDASTDQLLVGKGYTQTSPMALFFRGKPNTGSVVVEELSHTEIHASGTTTDVTNRGWNLVSNPYPAALDVVTFLTDNSLIDGSIYIWDDNGSNETRGSNSDYITANTIASIAGRAGTFDGYIGSMQAFFVRVTNASTDASISFDETHRVLANNLDDSFFRIREEGERTMIKLAMKGDFYNEIALGFREDATEGFDRLYDAAKLIGNENIAFYSMMNDEKYAIQGLPTLTYEQTVSLGYDLAKDGVYTFELAEAKSIPKTLEVILIDKENGTEYNLTENKSATISLTAGSNVNSFELVLRQSTVLELEDSNLSEHLNAYFSDDQTLNLDLDVLGYESAAIKIFDLMGRQVFNVNKASFDNNHWEGQVSLKSQKVYILQVTNGTSVISKKFIK